MLLPEASPVLQQRRSPGHCSGKSLSPKKMLSSIMPTVLSPLRQVRLEQSCAFLKDSAVILARRTA